jgi:uncharacterized protein involved in outer membrane biogenesis
MNNLLIAIAVFVITVVGALFAVPYFVDWNSYRSYFEEEASRAIGREVQVDGDVKLHLLPTPYFRIEKVRIADVTPAGLQEPFFRTDSLTVKLSIPPMFRGIVEANDIEFQRPILRLAVDAKGRWNWQSFAEALGAASYMPSNLTLTSLKISNGVLALHGPDGAERGRLEGLNAELSAPALSGPYRFRSAFAVGGAERELRLATAVPEPDGSVRLRASLRLVDSGATYLLDARMVDLMGKARVDGDLTARLPVAGLWHTSQRQPSRTRPAPDEELKIDRDDAAFDLKGSVKADAAGAQLSDLELSFEQDGRPQLISGTVQASWQDTPSLEMSLSSRWLDLDRITGATEGSGPLESIAKLAAGVREILPGYRSRISLAIDQANLGGDAVASVQLLLARSTDVAEVQHLRIALPGGSRGDLQGTIAGSANAPSFAGNLKLRGASISRFVAWATGSKFIMSAKRDAHFSVDAHVAVASGRFEVKDLVANLTGTALKGSALYRWEGRPELSVALEGPQLDARALLPAGSDLTDVYAFFTSLAPGSGAAPGSRVQPNVRLALRTGLLATADRTYRDVNANVELSDGHLRQLLLRLSGEEGYALELTGRIDDAVSRPKGAIRGSVIARTAAGLAATMDLLGLPQALRLDGARAGAAVPLRLAGSLAFGGRTATSTDLVADGEANGMTVKLAARLEGGPGDWKDEGADVSAAIDASDRSKIASLLFAGRPASAGSAAAPGRILIKAAGIPLQGLTSVAGVDTGDLTVRFRGRLNFGDLGMKAAGDLEVRASDGTDLATLVDASLPVRMEGVPVIANLKLSLGDGKLGLQDVLAQIGDTKIAGQVVVSRSAERYGLEGVLHADEISLPQLLAPLLDQRLALAGMAEAAISGRHGLWPDVAFSASALEAVEGQLEVNCRRLTVADRIALNGARLKIGLSAGKVEVKELTGSALGGEFGGRVSIDRIGAGAEVRGKLSFSAAPEQVFGESVSSSRTPMRGSVEFAGRGTSPRAVVAAMQGKGSIDFKEVKIAALWPGAIALAADAALKTEPDKLSATVKQTLAAGLASGSIPLGPRSIALEIGDGQLRTKPLIIETDEGQAGGTASLDLGSLNFRSLWRLEAKAPGAGAAAGKLPPVAVQYDAPIAALGAHAPRIDSAALEQELSARRIERDVEELERLRKLDEQRRLMESERMRRQFDQTPPVQRPPLPGVPIAPSGREQRPAPG